MLYKLDELHILFYIIPKSAELTSRLQIALLSSLLWVEFSSLKKNIRWSPNLPPLQPQDVTLYGHGVFTEVIKLK